MIKLITDTSSEINPKEAQELGIVSLPMKLTFEADEFIPGVDMNCEQFYKRLKVSKELPHTSQLNIFDYKEALSKELSDGYEVFVLCISSQLSGSCNSLTQAIKELATDKVEFVDTKLVTFAYQSIVYETIKLIESGISLKNLKKEVEILCKRIELVAIVDNINYLIKGGRLSAGMGFLAKTLHIKPVVKIIDGKVQVVGKALGHNNAKKTLKSLIKEVDESMPMFIGHSDDDKKMNDLEEYLSEYTFAKHCEIGPIVGTHTGPGCVGITYFKK